MNMNACCCTAKPELGESSTKFNGSRLLLLLDLTPGHPERRRIPSESKDLNFVMLSHA